MQTPLRLIGYVRVSDVAGREGERFISPDVQRERIAAYATAHGHRIVNWKDDLDRSGADSRRPGLLDAIDLLESGDADGIAVAKLDRFARSQRLALDLLAKIEHAGGVLVSVEDNFDTSTPIGRAMRAILFVFAELEREQRREGLLTADRKAVERGVHVSAYAPVGYRRSRSGRLTIDEATAPHVHEVFLRRAAGAPWEELADYLDSHGVRTSRDGHPTGNFISRMIANPVYRGQARGPGGVTNDEGHPPIVSRDEWQAAQLPRRARPAAPTAALLSELARCSGCGRALTPANGYYRCKVRHPAGDCPSPAQISAARLEPYVEVSFLHALETVPTVDVSPGPSSDLADAAQAVELAENELTAYRDADVVTIIGQRSYREGLDVRSRRLENARSRLDELRETSALAGIASRRTTLAQEWPTLTTGERRTILAAAIDCIVVRRTRGTGRRMPVDERARILWAGTGPGGLPSRGRVVPLLDLSGVFDERDHAPAMAGAHHG